MFVVTTVSHCWESLHDSPNTQACLSSTVIGYDNIGEPSTRFLFIDEWIKQALIMSIKNIKASFILEEKVTATSKNCIFKQDNVVYTIYPHVRNLVNVTGIKRFEQLEIAKKIIDLNWNEKW